MTQITGTPDFLSATIQQAGADQLYENVEMAPGTEWTGTTNVAQGAYQWLAFVLQFPVSSAFNVGYIGANLVSAQQASKYFFAELPSFMLLPAWLPVGVAVDFQLNSSVAQTASGSLTIYGVRGPLLGLTPMFRYPCQNSLCAQIAVVTGTSTVIAAPGSGASILLGSILMPQINPQATTIATKLLGTIQGTVQNLGVSFAATSLSDQWVPMTGNGIKLDPDTALTVNSSSTPTGALTGTVFYDVVAQ